MRSPPILNFERTTLFHLCCRGFMWFVRKWLVSEFHHSESEGFFHGQEEDSHQESQVEGGRKAHEEIRQGCKQEIGRDQEAGNTQGRAGTGCLARPAAGHAGRET